MELVSFAMSAMLTNSGLQSAPPATMGDDIYIIIFYTERYITDLQEAREAKHHDLGYRIDPGQVQVEIIGPFQIGEDLRAERRIHRIIGRHITTTGGYRLQRVKGKPSPYFLERYKIIHSTEVLEDILKEASK